MKPFISSLIWLIIGPGQLALQAQQFMLPPATHQLSEPPGYDLFVNQMTSDAQKHLWLTSHNGLIQVDGQRLRTFHDPSQPQNDQYTALAPAPDGRIWLSQSRVGAGHRLAYFDPVHRRISSLSDTSRLQQTVLRNHDLTSLCVDHQGQLWLSVAGGGLLRINPATLTPSLSITLDTTVTAIAEGTDGRMWLGTLTGLYAFNPLTGQKQCYLAPTQSSLGSPAPYEITAIRVRSNGDVLIGLINEVAILTPSTGQIRRIKLPLPTPTSQMWTNAFVTDRFGNDYFSVGLMVFRLTTNGELQRLEFARPAEKIISILVVQGQGDEPDWLWVNAAHRLDQYDLSRLRSLPALNVLDVVVNGTRLIENEQKVDDRFQRDAAGRASLRVQEDDFLQLRFAPYAELKQTIFRYKLDGYDRQWTSYDDQLGVVTYQLPAGQYTFLFNRAGHEGWAQPGRIQISVQPPFWKTTWFITLLVVGLSGLLYWGIRAGRRRQKLRQELARQQGEADSLRQLDEFRTQFFANITHEFRTPLTIILNATESLTHASLLPKEQERLGTIQRNAQQLLGLINETLDIAKLDAGKLESHTRLGDPLRFVEQVVAQFTGLAEQKAITLSWQASQTDEALYAFDDDKLEKISYNLLANALKFTPAGGQVQVEGQITEKNRLVVRVADTGIGIEADQLSRIFERFHQADASSTRAYSGTGLGLALVRELVEWLGGSVTVESIVGQGSRFVVDLPLAPSESAAQADIGHEPIDGQLMTTQTEPALTDRSPSPNALIRPDKSLVLVVEDNPEMRSYVEEALAEQYQVIVADHGRAGLELAVREVPDLIVSDVMMPELDGYQLVESLKADERTSHIPVILLTAKSSYNNRMKGLDVGADDYLSKPFSLAELTLRVGNNLRTRRNWKQWLTTQSTLSANNGHSHQTLPLLDKEERFLTRLRQQILDHLDSGSLDVDWLANQASMSRTQLHRKLNALTGLSPNRFIHQVRLQKAVDLLQSGKFNVAQAAYKVGYSSPSHFSRVFQEHFGYTPANLK